jgi:hypothetical protein
MAKTWRSRVLPIALIVVGVAATLLAVDIFVAVATEGVSVGAAAGPGVASAMLLVFGIGFIWGGVQVWSDHT